MILIRIFRICAITEAVTWIGLLASMYEKYIAHTHSAAIHIFGSVHGYAFLAYVLVVFLVRAEYRWTNRMTLLALVVVGAAARDDPLRALGLPPSRAPPGGDGRRPGAPSFGGLAGAPRRR